MRVTVTQLPDDRQQFERAWTSLVQNTQAQRSELVLLPELIFSQWLFDVEYQDEHAWQQAVAEHEDWAGRISELNATYVLTTFPTAEFTNAGVIWRSETQQAEAVHNKAYLPNEETCWESNWYRAGEAQFTTRDCGSARIGYLICTEMWFPEHARTYGMQGAHFVLSPRGTERSSVEKWITGGRVAAISAGAFSLSANRTGYSVAGTEFGGAGWIIDPDGNVLGVTSDEEPFITLDLDLTLAERAKHTYPRNIWMST